MSFCVWLVCGSFQVGLAQRHWIMGQFEFSNSAESVYDNAKMNLLLIFCYGCWLRDKICRYYFLLLSLWMRLLFFHFSVGMEYWLLPALKSIYLVLTLCKVLIYSSLSFFEWLGVLVLREPLFIHNCSIKS